jgi:hypothetical protein
MSWIVFEKAAPVLNTDRFDLVFGTDLLRLNEWGHPSAYEFVALAGMSFEIEQRLNDRIVAFHWPEYSNKLLYTDCRFCSISTHRPNRVPHPPSREEVLARMESRVGARYVWGGNWCCGIEEMLSFYPPPRPIDAAMRTLWTLQGTDCSGLFFEAMEGLSPRNTSHLRQAGTLIATELNARTNRLLRPLDLILYPGHVLFVRDRNTIIESKSPFGVRIVSLEERVAQVRTEPWCMARRYF